MAVNLLGRGLMKTFVPQYFLPLSRHLSDRVGENGIDVSDQVDNEKTFQELLDQSPLMKFGRPAGKCVIGRIVDICNDDLYVDFGAKFEAVVQRPNHNAEFYKRGSKVRLLLNKFEITGAFLGDARHITLCEAGALLLGPYNDVSKT